MYGQSIRHLIYSSSLNSTYLHNGHSQLRLQQLVVLLECTVNYWAIVLKIQHQNEIFFKHYIWLLAISGISQPKPCKWNVHCRIYQHIIRSRSRNRVQRALFIMEPVFTGNQLCIRIIVIPPILPNLPFEDQFIYINIYNHVFYVALKAPQEYSFALVEKGDCKMQNYLLIQIYR